MQKKRKKKSDDVEDKKNENIEERGVKNEEENKIIKGEIVEEEKIGEIAAEIKIEEEIVIAKCIIQYPEILLISIKNETEEEKQKFQQF